ncbi:MAG: PadR family transcriptional regulator [Arthrobacter sp.]|uniref:PadR family transcriptional regulator n=1 Tax=Arthrobacter sp. 179 TaxID=3457734 RepID=UPI002653DC4F|nr:PadR family transcriptional regulator [Micrococcaceae bacterium]MDN5813720.1 PadR family transcriptional regulator [Micrococcaceae bacterium]MDN5825113.1 PadR family transcriptional regulator [Micrococcaceae bacterium]MDN5878223.1 PadR family transcriptional regulator [Micrococcaceae bacterium]MDN5885827.1 PadR family transcriptional regulator [Micrococcaceae bacterium]
MILARLILGLLSLSPMTGYDLKKHFDSSINHFWNADKAQIYRTLAQLVDQGLATVRTVPQENYPARQEHHITEAGRAALQDWLTGTLDRQPAREPFLGRIFFSGELERHEVLELLAARRTEAEDLQRSYRALRAELDEAALADRRGYLMAATLDHGIAHVGAELNWLDSVEGNLP